MKIKGGSYFLIGIMAAMCAIIILSLEMEYLESKLLPIILGGIVFVLAAVGLWKDALLREKDSHRASQRAGKSVEKHPQQAPPADRNAEKEFGSRALLLAGAWIVGFFLAIYVLGFVVSIPLFVLSYMMSHGTRWPTAIISTVLATVFIYAIFELLLNVHLYPGLLLPALMG